jgi:hypothetical protein
MSTAFAVLKDPRGGFVELPAAPSGQTFSRFEFLYRMKELRHSYLRHLFPEQKPAEAGSHLEYATRTASSGKDEHRLYIALHHFHPRIVRECAKAGGAYKVPMTLSEREFKRMGIAVTEQDRVTDISSGKPTQEFYVVPNYSLDQVYQDLRRLARSERDAAELPKDIYNKAKEAIANQKSDNCYNCDGCKSLINS